MCQGAFAERGLFMRAGPGDSKMVTDIDVIAHDYSINFHHRRIYAECKGGKHRSALDRVVWVRGIKETLVADDAYLVLDHCDPSTVRFARSQNIEILQESSLETLEDALRIAPDFWPGRCNFLGYKSLEAYLRKVPSRPAVESVGAWLRQAMEVWQESSALTFSYGRLNALLGLLQQCNNLPVDPSFRPEETEAVSFAVSAMLVRLSQYVLFIASDTLAMTKAERIDYLSERLVSGGLDIGQSRQILSGALQMVNAQLSVAGLEAPASWNIDSMLSSPAYTRPLAVVVERVVSDGHRSAMLPVAMELRQFGFNGKESIGGTLLSRARYGSDMAGLVVAFARQSLEVPEMLTRGIAALIPGMNSIHSKATQPEVDPGGSSAENGAKSTVVMPANAIEKSSENEAIKPPENPKEPKEDAKPAGSDTK
jgi:hypothetical protein